MQGLSFDFLLYWVMIGDSLLDMGLMEFKLLYFFMIYLEWVYSCEQLLNYVWGINVYVEDCMVDVYICCLCKVLEYSGYDCMV